LRIRGSSRNGNCKVSSVRFPSVNKEGRATIHQCAGRFLAVVARHHNELTYIALSWSRNNALREIKHWIVWNAWSSAIRSQAKSSARSRNSAYWALKLDEPSVNSDVYGLSINRSSSYQQNSNKESSEKQKRRCPHLFSLTGECLRFCELGFPTFALWIQC